jgi:hypothetical protein
MFLFISVFYVLSDLVQIYKEKQRKLFWLYTILLTLDFIMTLLVAMDVPLPSPSFPIKKMITSILGL